jgi:hypothetical protein
MKKITIATICSIFISAAVYAHGDKGNNTNQSHGGSHHGEMQGKSTLMTFTNKMVEGKKTWVMNSVKASLKEGMAIQAHLINKLDAAHGFEIAGAVKPIVVAAKETKTVNFVLGKAGAIKFSCHLHAAHVGGSFEVK